MGAGCGLHPLIHTIAPETSAQDVEKKKAEPVTPHFLSLNQDIVAGSQEVKCGLKYGIFTQPRNSMKLFAARPSEVFAVGESQA